LAGDQPAAPSDGNLSETRGRRQRQVSEKMRLWKSEQQSALDRKKERQRQSTSPAVASPSKRKRLSKAADQPTVSTNIVCKFTGGMSLTSFRSD